MFDTIGSNTSLEEKLDLSTINSSISKSTTHLIQPIGVPRQIGGLITKTILSALNKVNKKNKIFH